MLVFLRHAERGDNQFPEQNSEIPHDPPITTLSSNTIAQTAQQLIVLFRHHHIRKVRVVCSKFLRCLMTAEKLAQLLSKAGMEIISPYQINNQVGQYMRQDWFKSYPLHNLIFDGKHRQQYLKENNWKEVQNTIELPFPENYVMFHQRVGQYKDKLKFPDPSECLLVVTHGFVVREMCWRMNQVPNIFSEVPYCGFAAFTNDGKKDILVKAKL